MSILATTAVPTFTAQAYHQGKFTTVSDATVKGKWAVFFFYPADFTFVCPTELGDLAEQHPELQKMGVEVFGISTDTHFVHKAWHDTSDTIKKVTYPLVGDPTGTLTRAFGVHDEASGLANRGTFVVTPEGKVVVAELHADGIGRNASELVRKIQAAQFVHSHPGEVCPAKWKPGAATLKPGLDLVGKI
jgi:peroxiredoxin